METVDESANKRQKMEDVYPGMAPKILEVEKNGFACGDIQMLGETSTKLLIAPQRVFAGSKSNSVRLYDVPGETCRLKSGIVWIPIISSSPWMVVLVLAGILDPSNHHLLCTPNKEKVKFLVFRRAVLWPSLSTMDQSPFRAGICECPLPMPTPWRQEILT